MKTNYYNGKRLRILIIILAGILMSFSACKEDTPTKPSTSSFPVPTGFPALPIPDDNPMNDAKIELGRMLFYDTRLSRDGSISCGNCHYQQFGFADSTPVSRGVSSETGIRNSPVIINTAYTESWFWDGRATTLEQQILAAMTSPIEMYADTNIVRERLSSDSVLRLQFTTAFNSTTTPNVRDGVKALAAFCRSLISGNSRYDRYVRGDVSALNDSEKRGLQLFTSSRTQCSSCHSGFNFTDNQFHSVGLHTHYYDEGRFYATKREQDVGKFRTPTLRNIEVSKPYMNEGLFQTLEEVMEHYNSGGKIFINKDERIKPLNLTKQEIADIIAFMKSLSDEEFLRNSKFARPRN